MSRNDATEEKEDVSFIKVKEQLVEKARQFNLLSNVFLSVALKDIPACQHVLYVNAAVDDGSDIAKLMHYFRTANPGDMSQGSLSARVNFLKCEEGGYQEMCEVSEEIYNIGWAEGEMKKAREIALSLSKKGTSAPSIAETVQVDLEVVEQWLSGAETAKP